MSLPRIPPQDRKWWAVGIVGCLAATAVVVWFGLSATVGRIAWETHSYEVVNDSTVDVAFIVHRPANAAVTCQLKALNESFGTVGLLDVSVPAGPRTTVSLAATIRTTARAVSGTVVRCAKA